MYAFKTVVVVIIIIRGGQLIQLGHVQTKASDLPQGCAAVGVSLKWPFV